MEPSDFKGKKLCCVSHRRGLVGMAFEDAVLVTIDTKDGVSFLGFPSQMGDEDLKEFIATLDYLLEVAG